MGTPALALSHRPHRRVFDTPRIALGNQDGSVLVATREGLYQLQGEADASAALDGLTWSGGADLVARDILLAVTEDGGATWIVLEVNG